MTVSFHSFSHVCNNPQSSHELDSGHVICWKMSKPDAHKERERDGKLHPRKRRRPNPSVAYVEPLKPVSRE